ncbi:PucR family transcriptional regulator ligand-binding domain-containing protein [Sporolactobacillus sp. STSJ-5]|uniref:PucR family transcriptional regulator n=1 Tax=Sporolactobacillus sp. STSJ-5 TaxID=2965076 RepID=UPI002106095F|nr:PucR family transcriptional regulator ligand-binding domain-containing protein [Sporolactobacillus sp. STSJ-5]MCQ2009109.1 PucR family transcriptional regulator ligand-binding domain-containing protein [Sporolactobacillus sp. STSJ-5]
MDEMPFCVNDVLERPLFQRAALIAGAHGLFREVRWVHILEITHAAPYVSKHDLILTTGLWLKRSAKSGLEYMRQIIDHGTSGLCIEFGTTIDEIPDKIIALCDDHDFPLILFRQPIRFEEITQDIHSFLINQHFGLLKNLEQFSQKQQQLILQSTDIPAILRLLQSYSDRQIVYLSTIESNKFYPTVSEETAHTINTFCNEKKKNFDRIQETEIWKMDETRFLLIQPVVCFGQVFSCVGMLLHQAHPTEYMKLLIDYTAKAVATVLLRTQFLEEKILSNQNELIQDILSKRIENEDQAQMRMGLPSPNGEKYIFVGGIIEFEHNVIEDGPERMEARNQDILVLTRSLLKRYQMHHLLMMKNNQVYFICAKERVTSESLAGLYKNIQGLINGLDKYINQALPSLKFHVGIGKSRTRLSEVWMSFKEAYQVIEISQTVPAMGKCNFYGNLGVYQLLNAVPEPILNEFIHDQLGQIIDYDQKHHLNLVETLSMYFKCMGSKGETAKKLFIHRQTLYNRLEKIRDILGDDFFEPERRHCLEMALLGYPLQAIEEQ